MNPIDRYIKNVPEPQKTTLKLVRKMILEILPDGIECLSYGIPAIKYKGAVIGGFAAAKKHCSYYPFSGSTLKVLKKILLEYEQTKSALHFPLDKPLSKKIIKLLLTTRIAEVRPMKTKSRIIKPGGVDQYINTCPKEVRGQLQELRAAIREVAPDAVETLSYFDMPGYSYEGYEYNGMFVWFSFKSPFVRLHVRPVALVNHKKEVEKYTKTKAIISFPLGVQIPKTLVKKLVKSSLKDMKGTRK